MESREEDRVTGFVPGVNLFVRVEPYVSTTILLVSGNHLLSVFCDFYSLSIKVKRV